MGAANSSKITAVASGYPGRPMTGAIPARWPARQDDGPALAPAGVARLAVPRLGPLRMAKERGMTRADRDARHGDAADLLEERPGRGRRAPRLTRR